jgi:hypothetical protein
MYIHDTEIPAQLPLLVAGCEGWSLKPELRQRLLRPPRALPQALPSLLAALRAELPGGAALSSLVEDLHELDELDLALHQTRRLLRQLQDRRLALAHRGWKRLLGFYRASQAGGRSSTFARRMAGMLCRKGPGPHQLAARQLRWSLGLDQLKPEEVPS